MLELFNCEYLSTSAHVNVLCFPKLKLLVSCCCCVVLVGIVDVLDMRCTGTRGSTRDKWNRRRCQRRAGKHTCGDGV